MKMNDENFGIESFGLEALRVRHSRRGGRWTLPRASRASTGPARLEHHYMVTRLRPDSADGGLSNQPRASHDSLPRHPPNTVADPEVDTVDDDDESEETEDCWHTVDWRSPSLAMCRGGEVRYTCTGPGGWGSQR